MGKLDSQLLIYQYMLTFEHTFFLSNQVLLSIEFQTLSSGPFP